MKNCLIFECDLTLFLGNRSCALGIIYSLKGTRVKHTRNKVNNKK